MVDISVVPQADSLLREYENNAAGIKVIDANGTITSAVFAPPPDNTEGLVPVQLVLAYMAAPPAMYQAIKAFVVQRQAEIAAQLQAMGFTVPPSPTGAASAAA